MGKAIQIRLRRRQRESLERKRRSHPDAAVRERARKGLLRGLGCIDAWFPEGAEPALSGGKALEALARFRIKIHEEGIGFLGEALRSGDPDRAGMAGIHLARSGLDLSPAGGD